MKICCDHFLKASSPAVQNVQLRGGIAKHRVDARLCLQQNAGILHQAVLQHTAARVVKRDDVQGVCRNRLHVPVAVDGMQDRAVRMAQQAPKVVWKRPH